MEVDVDDEIIDDILDEDGNIIEVVASINEEQNELPFEEETPSED